MGNALSHPEGRPSAVSELSLVIHRYRAASDSGMLSEGPPPQLPHGMTPGSGISPDTLGIPSLQVLRTSAPAQSDLHVSARINFTRLPSTSTSAARGREL